MIYLYNDDNVKVMKELYNEGVRFDAIYADMIYEDNDYGEWTVLCKELLTDNGVFFVQTDYHTVYALKIWLDILFIHDGDGVFVNHLIYKQEWGGISKRCFPKKHDDILFYAKGKDYKFDYKKIMVPKVTANTKFDKRGDGLKIPCDVFDDLGNFSTISKERVKDLNGKNLQWQKPSKLINRLLLPTTEKFDKVLDPFLGTGTTGLWCKQNEREFWGIENNKNVFEIAKQRIEKE